MSVDAMGIALVAALAVAYAVGLARRPGQTRPARTVAWYLGVLSVGAATLTPLARSARHDFLATTDQFCLLFFLAPALLGLARPLALLSDRPPRTRPLALVAAAPALAAVATLLWFLTPWLAFSLHHEAVYQLGHLLALAAGCAFVAPALQAGLASGGTGYAALVFVALGELVLDAFPGIVVTLHGHLLAPSVFAAHSDARLSQVHGGEVLWVLGELVDIPFIAAVVRQWVVADAREAAKVDAELDARDRAAGQAGEAAPVRDDPNRERPWWETDETYLSTRPAPRRRTGSAAGTADERGGGSGI